MSDRQLEAWPELRVNERVNRAVQAGCDRAAYLIGGSWPGLSAANRSQMLYIVTAAMASFHHDLNLPE